MPSEAIAVANALNAYRMALLQLKFLRRQTTLSEGYLDFYVVQRRFYREAFRAQTEEAVRLLAQDPVFTPDYFANYAYARRLGLNIVHIKYKILNFGRSDAERDSYYDRLTHRYGLVRPYNTEILNYRDMAIGVMHADLQMHLFRYEEYKENIWRQRRFDRFNTVAEYSNKNAVAVAQDGAASFGFLSNALSAKADYYGNAANDLFASAGHAFQTGRNKVKTSFGIPTSPTVPNSPAPIGGKGSAVNYANNMVNQITSPTANTPMGRMYK